MKIYSEHALFMFIFGLIMIEIDIKENHKDNNSLKIDSLFYDFLIIIKDLNDGKEFDNHICNEFFKFAKLIGFINITDNIILKDYNFIGMYKSGKYKEYE